MPDWARRLRLGRSSNHRSKTSSGARQSRPITATLEGMAYFTGTTQRPDLLSAKLIFLSEGDQQRLPAISRFGAGAVPISRIAVPSRLLTQRLMVAPIP